MSFSISKNKMSFAADDLCTSRKLSNTSEQVVGKGTTHVLDTLTYDATDKVHHVQFQFRAYFPSTTSAQLPEKFSVRINDSLTEQCVTTLRDYYVLGSLHASCTDPIVKLEFSVTASAASNFTMPAGSCIHYGASPNEPVPTAASIPAPPPVVPSGPPAIVHGFTVPSHASIDDELEGDYRRFPFSFDRSGAAVTHRVVGIFERSVDSGSTIDAVVAVLLQNNGWDMWSAFKRTYSGAEYAAAQVVHNAGTGHEDYTSGYDFNAEPSWVVAVNEAFRGFADFTDGSGWLPGASHSGSVSLTTIEPS